MYTTTVKIRKILEDKKISIMFILLVMWILLVIASFVIGVKVTPVAFIAMIILFFMIIPITYFMCKTTAEFRGTDSFIYKEVTFNVVDGELYVDNKKLDVTYNKAENQVIVENVSIITTPRYNAKTHRVNFLGIIEKPYLDDFVKFLNEKGVKIKD